MRRHIIVGLCLLLASASAPALDTLEPLGAIFTQRPIVLTDDLVLETTGSIDVIRRYQADGRSEIVSVLDHGMIGTHRATVTDGGIVVTLGRPLTGGFIVTDVRDLSAPRVSQPITGPYYGTHGLCGTILTLVGSQCLLDYDLTDPHEPVFRSCVILPVVEGRRSLVQCGDRRVFIEDDHSIRTVTDVDLGTFDLAPGRIQALEGDAKAIQAMVATGDGDDQLIELVTMIPMAESWQETQRLVVTSGTGASVLDTERDGCLLLAALSDGTVRSFDLTRPTRPVQGCRLSAMASDLQISDHLIFVGTDADLVVYNRPQSGVPFQQLDRRGWISSLGPVMGTGDVRLMVSMLDSKLYRLDLTDPTLPRLAGGWPLPFQGMLVDNGHVAALHHASEPLIALIDIDDPMEPRELSRIDPAINFLGPPLINEQLLVTGSVTDFEARIFDISDPANPRPLSSFPSNHLRALGNGLLVASEDNVDWIWDISDPTNPRRRGQIAGHDYDDNLEFKGDLLYWTPGWECENTDIEVYDLSDPDAPQLIATEPWRHGSFGAKIVGDRLYGWANGYLDIWDISDPSDLVPTLNAPFEGIVPRPVLFHDDLLALGYLGLFLHNTGVTVTPPTPRATPLTPALQPAYPNPFNPSTTLSFDVPRAGRYQLTIHDARGRRVAKLVDSHLTAGAHQRTWTGLDNHGRPMASGIYLVQLSGAGLESHQTITLVK